MKGTEQMMKQKFFTVLSVLCVVLMIGIVGGVECGEPVSNLLWCIPTMLLAWVFAVFGGLTEN